MSLLNSNELKESQNDTGKCMRSKTDKRNQRVFQCLSVPANKMQEHSNNNCIKRKLDQNPARAVNSPARDREMPCHGSKRKSMSAYQSPKLAAGNLQVSTCCRGDIIVTTPENVNEDNGFVIADITVREIGQHRNADKKKGGQLNERSEQSKSYDDINNIKSHLKITKRNPYPANSTTAKCKECAENHETTRMTLSARSEYQRVLKMDLHPKLLLKKFGLSTLRSFHCDLDNPVLARPASLQSCSSASINRCSKKYASNCKQSSSRSRDASLEQSKQRTNSKTMSKVTCVGHAYRIPSSSDHGENNNYRTYQSPPDLKNNIRSITAHVSSSSLPATSDAETDTRQSECNRDQQRHEPEKNHDSIGKQHDGILKKCVKNWSNALGSERNSFSNETSLRQDRKPSLSRCQSDNKCATRRLLKEDKPYRQWHRVSRVVTAESKYIISPYFGSYLSAPKIKPHASEETVTESSTLTEKSVLRAETKRNIIKEPFKPGGKQQIELIDIAFGSVYDESIHDRTSLDDKVIRYTDNDTECVPVFADNGNLAVAFVNCGNLEVINLSNETVDAVVSYNDGDFNTLLDKDISHKSANVEEVIDTVTYGKDTTLLDGKDDCVTSLGDQGLTEGTSPSNIFADSNCSDPFTVNRVPNSTGDLASNMNTVVCDGSLIFPSADVGEIISTSIDHHTQVKETAGNNGTVHFITGSNHGIDSTVDNLKTLLTVDADHNIIESGVLIPTVTDDDGFLKYALGGDEYLNENDLQASATVSFDHTNTRANGTGVGVPSANRCGLIGNIDATSANKFNPCSAQLDDQATFASSIESHQQCKIQRLTNGDDWSMSSNSGCVCASSYIENHCGDFTIDQGDTVSVTPINSENISDMPTDGKEVNGLPTDGEKISGMSTDGKETNGMPTYFKDISDAPTGNGDFIDIFSGGELDKLGPLGCQDMNAPPITSYDSSFASANSAFINSTHILDEENSVESTDSEYVDARSTDSDYVDGMPTNSDHQDSVPFYGRGEVNEERGTISLASDSVDDVSSVSLNFKDKIARFEVLSSKSVVGEVPRLTCTGSKDGSCTFVTNDVKCVDITPSRGKHVASVEGDDDEMGSLSANEPDRASINRNEDDTSPSEGFPMETNNAEEDPKTSGSDKPVSNLESSLVGNDGRDLVFPGSNYFYNDDDKFDSVPLCDGSSPVDEKNASVLFIESIAVKDIYHDGGSFISLLDSNGVNNPSMTQNYCKDPNGISETMNSLTVPGSYLVDMPFSTESMASIYKTEDFIDALITSEGLDKNKIHDQDLRIATSQKENNNHSPTSTGYPTLPNGGEDLSATGDNDKYVAVTFDNTSPHSPPLGDKEVCDFRSNSVYESTTVVDAADLVSSSVYSDDISHSPLDCREMCEENTTTTPDNVNSDNMQVGNNTLSLDCVTNKGGCKMKPGPNCADISTASKPKTSAAIKDSVAFSASADIYRGWQMQRKTSLNVFCLGKPHKKKSVPKQKEGSCSFNYGCISQDRILNMKPLSSVSGVSEITGPPISSKKMFNICPDQSRKTTCAVKGPVLRTANRVRNTDKVTSQSTGPTGAAGAGNSSTGSHRLHRTECLPKHTVDAKVLPRGSKSSSISHKPAEKLRTKHYLFSPPTVVPETNTSRHVKNGLQYKKGNHRSKGEKSEETQINKPPTPKSSKVFLADMASRLLHKVSKTNLRVPRRETSKIYLDTQATSDHKKVEQGQISFLKGQRIKQQSCINVHSGQTRYGYSQASSIKKATKGVFPSMCISDATINNKNTC